MRWTPWPTDDGVERLLDVECARATEVKLDVAQTEPVPTLEFLVAFACVTHFILATDTRSGCVRCGGETRSARARLKRTVDGVASE
jgi:hypothetical protein